ncbi:putative sugar transferase EpsL [Neobacillus rhizosphaerae]|uniref:Sugar transferase EpsL n=1 Tax=Neobacillus rhizosphaerae TaxID=2880965 RepID=A0ABM9EQH7_9BACI|nr:sugar transferase [Neobacillus rhizosphaerae]CAH2714892.1 putative sugar transferase EpsL [Neobacillus rhizosphaerae]
MKRMIDLFGSFALIIIFSPIMLLIVLMIRIGMGSPILFKQIRPGLYGKPFCIYKFRTMIDKKDKNGNMLPGKLRLTKLGIFLRKYSLDEIPQLFNVIKGDISLVGPRPLLMEYLPIYSKEQARRHEVKPGITGWAQVNGRNSISWEEKFNLDVWYVNNHSLFLDLKIILLTIKKVFKKEGVSAKGHYSMEDFKGVNRGSGNQH